MHSLTKTTFRDHGHAVRSIHAKAHGELTVEAGLPAKSTQDLFATPARYRTVMRFSTQLGDILNAAVPATRGMAIEMFGVECERLLNLADDRTQNFVLVSDPAFFGAGRSEVPELAKQLTGTMDKAEGAKSSFP